ncbi:MAG: hypothetical protein GXO83_07680 [Chlorobi bacterium]|nr:hypothetical protein [Chlorobiota bacterium]
MWKQGEEEKALNYFTITCQNQHPTERPEGTTKEGDTRSGKSLERQLHRSISGMISSDLPAPGSPDLKNEMKLFYQKLDLLFVK